MAPASSSFAVSFFPNSNALRGLEFGRGELGSFSKGPPLRRGGLGVFGFESLCLPPWLAAAQTAFEALWNSVAERISHPTKKGLKRWRLKDSLR